MSADAIRVETDGLHLQNPTILASGVQGTSLGRVLDALKFGAGAAVTKSIGPRPREGYKEPTLVEVDSGWVNAAGLPNPGAVKFSEELGSVKGRSLPVIVSIFGGDGKEFGDVVEKLDGNEFIAYELNLSCPHVEGVGTEIGHDPEEVSRVVRAVRSRTKKPIFAKLSPNTDRLVEVAAAAVDAGADGLTAINTIRSVPIDIESGRPSLSNVYGGLSGPAIRPVALRCVYELREAFDVPIMGCGGVVTWKDAVQFMLAGANAVQVGTGTLAKMAVFNDINLGIISYLERKGLSRLDDLVGSAHGKGSG
ncbi:MAG: dihydroorotate dehydrogenase [Thaumarchaeota archaeon]|nr:dihydroorotate dehydrogenase [Nitrososphaerota archaeon]